MEASGSVTDRDFYLAVSWNNGARGIYKRALLSDGSLAGRTWDEMSPSGKGEVALWPS
jgi:hypothetical protein